MQQNMSLCNFRVKISFKQDNQDQLITIKIRAEDAVQAILMALNSHKNELPDNTKNIKIIVKQE